MSIFNNVLVLFLCLVLACQFSACEKSQISPANQSIAFIKYYGHVSNQAASDLKRTEDGGYIMVGSTNSYTTEDESDIFVVKTDALGNEMWSRSYGKTAANGTGSLTSKYIRFDEKGISIDVLPEGAGYVLACNRTYVEYETSSSTERSGVRWTKVVMYRLGPEGEPELQEGVELRSNTEFTEKVSDMKIDTSSGIIKFVLTGYTTDISSVKPQDLNNGIYDKTDIFTAQLDESFTLKWTTLAYGFVGNDYGASVHILDDNYYFVTGTTEEQYNFPDAMQTRIIGVKMTAANGIPIDPKYFGDVNYDIEGGSEILGPAYGLCSGHSVYDRANDRITISGMVKSGNNQYNGHMFLFQIDGSLSPQTPNPDDATFGFKFYRPADPAIYPPATTNTYHPVSIDLIPNSGGFVISTTHKKIKQVEHNIAIIKVDNSFEISEGWPSFYGYEDVQAAFSTLNEAGTVIAVKEEIDGASSAESLKGYAFTGTFRGADIGAGANHMIGLIKLNDNGNFEPPE
jgi:hypothetical protein